MKVLMLSLVAIVLALQFRLWVSSGGMREVWRLRREVASQQLINEGLKQRNRTLAGEVQDLKDGKAAIEETARTDLGMIGTNETFFQMAPTAEQKVTESSDAPNSPDSASTTDQPILTNHKATKQVAPTLSVSHADSH